MTSSSSQFFLASASPRRRQLLEQIGVRFNLLAVSVEETRAAGESPEQFVTRLAVEKARAGWSQLSGSKTLPVLGADTIVVIDDEVLGKPIDRQHGMSMLQRISGRTHEVLTAVAVVESNAESGVHQRLSRTRVRMREISINECRAYWETGEPVDKAGGYAIQGHAAIFIEEIHGSYTGVVGLPLFESAELLQGCGIPLLAVD